MNDFKKVILFGFTFGSLFSLVAFLGSYNIDRIYLICLPIVVATLCFLGAIVAHLANHLLQITGSRNSKLNTVISFFCAAFVNSFIVYSVLAITGNITLHRELIIGSLTGISLGALYSLYCFQVDNLRQRMLFLEQLSNKNKQLQETSRKLAIIEERNRMGRELHDSVSQGLHGLIFSLYSLKSELKPSSKEVAEIVHYMETTAKATLDELRAMIEELKPSLLEEGLERAIKVTANLFSQRISIPIDVNWDLNKPVCPNLEMTIYRITQEVLSNIEKHSHANRVMVNIQEIDENIIFTISDDGNGFVRKKSDSR
ncbi:MAG: histidine kinase [Bacillaceae bacterium]|nr:histidine kinase [Bacillaceae bacterium]